MKFDHNFTQTAATPTGRTYAADGWQAQLDFLPISTGEFPHTMVIPITSRRRRSAAHL